MCYYVEAFSAKGWVRVSHYCAHQADAHRAARAFMFEHAGAVAIVRRGPLPPGESLHATI